MHKNEENTFLNSSPSIGPERWIPTKSKFYFPSYYTVSYIIGDPLYPGTELKFIANIFLFFYFSKPDEKQILPLS